MIEMPDNGVESRTLHQQADASLVRSVYLPLLRGVTPHTLEAFDPVTQTLVTGQREATTVPTQALFLLNSSFVRRQALALSEQLRTAKSPRERIRQAYRLILNREPNAVEVARAQKFVDEFESAYAVTPALPPKPTAVATKPAAPTAPLDPDNIDRADYIAIDPPVEPGNASTAAWMSFAQALFSSAEFRFVR